jgi:hypothetical protein
MKQGEKVGPEIEDRVCQWARDYPGWSQERIAKEVFSSFHVTIHRSTVGSILARRGVRRNVPHAHSGSVEDENPAQAERSGHWPGLRTAARTLRKQLSAPPDQLLGLGKLGNYNSCLILESSGDQLKVTLKVEEELLFSALREHLPDKPAWDILERWKRQVKEIHRRLSELCWWVMEQPEIQGLPSVARIESATNASGLTEAYAKTVLLESVDDARRCGTVGAFRRRPIEQMYEISPQSLDTNQRVLEWKLAGLRCVIAVGEDSGELERLKGLHIRLQEDIRSIPEFRAVVECFKELGRLREALQQELQWIEHLPKFPGSCGLWSG